LLQRFYIGIYTGTVEAMPMACLTLAATPIVLNLKKNIQIVREKIILGQIIRTCQ